MSDPNSNAVEAGAVDATASGNGENQLPQGSSGEDNVLETGVPPLENADSEFLRVLGTEALIDASVASTVQSIDDNVVSTVQSIDDNVVNTVQSIDDTDLHSAVVSTTDADVDYTLDQLTNSSDLFDVPALDFSDHLPT